MLRLSRKMEAVQKEYWYFLVLVLSLHLLKDSEQLRAPEVSVRLQEGMVLDCLCPWTGQLSMVSWTKGSEPTPLAIYHPQYGANYSPKYDGRVEFLNKSSMDWSIVLTNVTEEDVGVYHCNLQMFPQGSWTKDTRVNKEEISPTVPHPPETELILPRNGSLTIRCDPLHQGILQQVSLEKLGAEQSVVMALCGRKGGEMEVVEWSERASVNCSEELGLSVVLNDVSQLDAGLYRCNYSTNTTVHTTTILLRSLQQPGLDISQDLMLYTVVGGAGAVVLVAVFLLLVWLSKRKRRRGRYLHPADRRHNAYDQGAVYDRMKKGTRQQRRNSPIYANLQTIRAYQKTHR